MKKVKQFLLSIITFIVSPIVWLASSFDGPDGKASGKKFTAMFLTILTAWYSAKVHDNVTLYAFIALLLSVLMMWGIISSHNIITFTRALSNKAEHPEQTKKPEGEQ